MGIDRTFGAPAVTEEIGIDNIPGTQIEVEALVTERTDMFMSRLTDDSLILTWRDITNGNNPKLCIIDDLANGGNANTVVTIESIVAQKIACVGMSDGDRAMVMIIDGSDGNSSKVYPISNIIASPGSPTIGAKFNSAVGSGGANLFSPNDSKLVSGNIACFHGSRGTVGQIATLSMIGTTIADIATESYGSVSSGFNPANGGSLSIELVTKVDDGIFGTPEADRYVAMTAKEGNGDTTRVFFFKGLLGATIEEVNPSGGGNNVGPTGANAGGQCGVLLSPERALTFAEYASDYKTVILTADDDGDLVEGDTNVLAGEISGNRISMAKDTSKSAILFMQDNGATPAGRLVSFLVSDLDVGYTEGSPQNISTLGITNGSGWANERIKNDLHAIAYQEGITSGPLKFSVIT